MHKTPVKVRGRNYESAQNAARYTGVHPATVTRHLNRYGHLEYLGRKAPRERLDRCKPVTLFGIKFKSISAAAEALGVDRKTIRNMEHSEAARETVMIAAMECEARRGRG
jgi:hypothetical protein